MPLSTTKLNILTAPDAGGGAQPVPQGEPGIDGPYDGTQAEEERKPVWSSKVDFLASLVGFTVNLSCFWDFPYMAFTGGGVIVFMIPYLIFLVLGAFPIYYMELALGQHTGKGVIASWSSLNPILKGIGYASVILCFYMVLYGNFQVAKALHYLVLSFGSTPPWTTCNNRWNTENCYSMSNPESAPNISLEIHDDNSADYIYERKYSSADEYQTRWILDGYLSERVEGAEGGGRWQIAISLLFICIFCFFVLWKGIRVFGKVMWFTALFPYVAMLILFIRCATLSGATDGLLMYLVPSFDKLLKMHVWTAAASYASFSLASGYGVSITLSSYNRRNNKIDTDAFVSCAIIVVTGFLAGLLSFSMSGYMAKESGEYIYKVVRFGPSEAFVSFADGLSTLPGASFWLILYFFMLICVGIDSTFGFMECVIRGLEDEFPIIRRRRWAALLILFSFIYLFGLILCSPIGPDLLRTFDSFPTSISLRLVALCEIIAVAWIYGAQRFSCDIKTMLPYPQPMEALLKIFWQFITPISLGVIIVLTWLGNVIPMMFYYSRDSPWWVIPIGLCLTLAPLVCIVAFAIYEIVVKQHGQFMQAIRGSPGQNEGQNEVRNLETYTITTTTTITKTGPGENV